MLLLLAKERLKKKKKGRQYNRRRHSSTTLKRNTKTREQHVLNSLRGKIIDWGVWTALFIFSHRTIICLKEQEPATILANRPAEEVEGLCRGFTPRGKLGLRPSGSRPAWSLGEVLKLLPPGLGYHLWLPRFGICHSGRSLSFRAQRADNESLPVFLSAGERMQGFHWFSQPALLLESRSPVQAMRVRPEPPRAG